MAAHGPATRDAVSARRRAGCPGRRRSWCRCCPGR
jgi:hypothetical protein